MRPRTTTIGPQFSGDFFSRHPARHRPLYCFRCLLLMQFSSAWALYVTLSTLILLLRQPIRPFTTNKALSEPLNTAIGPFFLRAPSLGRGIRGGLRRLWSSLYFPLKVFHGIVPLYVYIGAMFCYLIILFLKTWFQFLICLVCSNQQL